MRHSRKMTKIAPKSRLSHVVQIRSQNAVRAYPKIYSRKDLEYSEGIKSSPAVNNQFNSFWGNECEI